MDRGAKGKVVAGLCDDMMVEILSRVPVKDVRRSKCVSKPWRDLIADPLHRKKLPQTLEGFFHCGGGGHCGYGHFTSVLGSGECVPPVDPSFSFLTAKLPGFESMALLDSCNGLLLFGCRQEDRFGYIVCNPATEELMTVPASSGSCPHPPTFEERDVVDDRGRYAHTYLMFDPAVSLRFHLVQFWGSRHWGHVDAVYSYSSETRTWSDRSSKWERGEEGGERGLPGEVTIEYMLGRALVNGLLHFIVHHYHVGKREILIVAVDGEGNICRITRWHDKHVASAFIGQSQGRLLSISTDLQYQRAHFHFTQLSVWVLEDYDTQEWILKHNVSTLQLFGSLSCLIDNYNIVAIHPDHNSIILVQHWNQKLVSYDLDSKELRALCTLGEGDPDSKELRALCTLGEGDPDSKELCDEGYLFITPYVPYFMESPVLATKD